MRSACRSRSSTLVTGDTDLTADAGKTSASRQTFVSGKAAELAGRDLRQQILRLANAGPDAALALDGATLTVRDGGEVRTLDLATRRAALMGEGTLRSADHAARRRRPGRALRDLCLRRPDRHRRGRYRARHGEGAAHRGRPRCRQGDQPDPGRRPDPGRHRAGAGPRADGGIPARPHREPARLPDPDHRRRARDRVHPDRGPRAARPVRRQGRRRAGPGADRAGDPGRHPPRDRRAHAPRAGAAAPAARSHPRARRRRR